jgi:outer membrane protein insertion porin family
MKKINLQKTKIQKHFLLLATTTILAIATSANAAVIKDIKVTGLQSVERPTLDAFLAVKAGQNVSDDQISAAIQRAFDTGLFKDVQITAQGSSLIVNVVENPVIAEVKIEGNDKLSDDKITPELKLASRSIFNESDVQADVRRIQTLYTKNGRFNVAVEPKIEKLENNRINLIYEISEGIKSKINQISFVNNNAFDEDDLEGVISTKETRWYRFFSGDDNYDPDRIEFDKEQLRKYYISNGYPDFKVTSADAEFNPSAKAFNITYTLDEGKKYNFGAVDLESQIADVPVDEIKKLIKTKSGNLFDASLVEATTTEISEYLGDKGYAFVDIRPDYIPNAETGSMDIKYMVQQGPKVYVNRLNISGNVRTQDDVIRREFRLAEGDPYDASKIKRSKQRIEELGFFGKVDVRNTVTDQPDKVDLDVAVEEQSTGELTFGAGLSSTEGVIGDVSITERNLLGKGQFLRLNLTAASSRRDIQLSFTEPYFMERNFAAGFDLFNTTRTSSSFSNLSFDSNTLGARARGTYSISEYVKHDIKYTIKDDEISNPDANASIYVVKQVGQRITSEVGQTFTYNTLDSTFFPSEGLNVSLDQDYAGIGGDVKYLRHELKSTYYHPILENNKELVLKLAAKGGMIIGTQDDDVRINDRFFVGGNTIRGFDNQGIGPRDRNSGDPLGGNKYYSGTAEVVFPLGLPKELGFRGAAFADAASLYDVDEVATVGQPIDDDSSLRSAVGMGVYWKSPVGPIRVDYANPINKESYDKTESLRFSFGTRF